MFANGARDYYHCAACQCSSTTTILLCRGSAGASLHDRHETGDSVRSRELGVEVVTVGPQAWDMVAQAEALEQTIARRPAGIVIPVWDATVVPRDQAGNEGRHSGCDC